MLPSKYAPGGLLSQDQRRTITTGTRRPPKPVEYSLKQLGEKIEHAVNHPTPDQDVEMIAMDDVRDVDAISEYVARRRHSMSYDLDIDESAAPHEAGLPRLYVIIDTNFILSHLNIVDEIKRLAAAHGILLVIPIAVTQELDGLKNSTKSNVVNGMSQLMAHLARWANDWVYKQLADNSPVVRGQRMDQRLDRLATKDDAILDCCLYFQKEYPDTLQVLMSNDKNLCARALTNGVLTVSFRSHMSGDVIANAISAECNSRFPSGTHTLRSPKMAVPEDVISTVYSEITTIAVSVVRHAMEKEYGDISVRGYDQNRVRTLRDCVTIMDRFWIQVFEDYFQDFVPFERHRDRRNYVWVDRPGPDQLKVFVHFWCKVLTVLYRAVMSDDQMRALDVLKQRWSDL